ncbi:MAG: 50S ribosomal protein L21 [Kiritimatiellae bacterium]|jgi:large subunit ribosomal protein L21|nr:50S ribosomal protein L21 [Kiritimatiellia bacterium]
MEAYAVIQTGGKQYRVEAGQTIEIERLADEAGQEVQLTTVLALSDGATLKVGTPFVDGAAVVLVIKEHFRGEKLINFKKKRRKGYHRKMGHRQELTRAVVKSIA